MNELLKTPTSELETKINITALKIFHLRESFSTYVFTNTLAIVLVNREDQRNKVVTQEDAGKSKRFST